MDLDFLLKEIPTDFNVVLDTQKEHFIVLRSSMANEDDAMRFLKEYSRITDTHWITYRSLSEPEKCIFSRKWVCHHHKKNKSIASLRNFDCKAFIDLKIKRVNKDTKSKDAYLKRLPPLCAVIKINLEHSHPIRTADMFRMLRVTDEVKEKFHNFFSIGMGPTEASQFHEASLISEGVTYEAIASSAINPTLRQVGHLHQVWKMENFGPVFNPFEKLFERSKIYEENGATVKLKESSPWAVLIVTSVMKRAQQLPSSQEIIFLDSTSSCDLMSSALTILITATKVGAVPIAALIHQAQTTENYAVAFELLKEHFPNCFGGEECPRLFMTDDSAAEKGALSLVWPTAKQLLCHFHVAQAEWRYLWGKSVEISKEERLNLMKMFQKVMYASSEEDCENAAKMILDLAEKFPHFVQRFKNFFLRKEEWVKYFRIQLVNRSHNTNNYCEATIRILKDVILSRTKAFNAVALTEFLISVWDSYLSSKLLDHAYARNPKGQILYRSMCKTISKDLKVEHIDESFYQVESESRVGESYTVNAAVGVCSCPVGLYGAFCKHQFVLHQKEGVMLPNLPPVSQQERHALAVLAVGIEKSPNLSFFLNFNGSLADEIAPISFEAEPTTSAATVELTTTVEPTIATEEDKMEFLNEVKRWEALCGGFPKTSISTLVKAMKTCQSKEDVVAAIRSTSLTISVQTRARKGKKIKVQPTSIARRTLGLTRGCSRLPQGRPLNGAAKSKGVKRKRNLSLNVKLNQPNAKSHGSGH